MGSQSTFCDCILQLFSIPAHSIFTHDSGHGVNTIVMFSVALDAIYLHYAYVQIGMHGLDGQRVWSTREVRRV